MKHIYSECKAYFAGGCAVNMHYLNNKTPLDSCLAILISQFQMVLIFFLIGKLTINCHLHRRKFS